MTNLCDMLNLARREEADSPTMYEKIRDAISNKSDKAKIKKIIEDEERHYNIISEISKMQCNK